MSVELADAGEPALPGALRSLDRFRPEPTLGVSAPRSGSRPAEATAFVPAARVHAEPRMLEAPSAVSRRHGAAKSAPPKAGREPVEVAPPPVRVTIGRIDVWAAPAAPESRRPEPRASTPMSLEEYLQKRPRWQG
jgi:hypothetical protein